MKKLTDIALNTAKLKGAQYADIRIIEDKRESITTRNNRIGNLEQTETLGFGVRVIYDGAWGFASSSIVTSENVGKVTEKAVEIAKASAKVKKTDIKLTDDGSYVDFWQSPYLIDPFSVPLSEKIDLCFEIDKVLRSKSEVKVSQCSMDFWREHQWMATTEGSFIEQLFTRSGVGYLARSVGNHDTQTRSYPLSHRGMFMAVGYELIDSLKLLENAERVRDEAVALLTAENCPTVKKDLILTGTQMFLQIHESVGHPSELDRVLGFEANYAGRSFATTEKLNNFKYGSNIVNLVADNTLPGGLSTAGYDDDGVPAKRWYIVKDGILKGYMTNREVAHYVDQNVSMGSNRAEGFNNIPIIRISNLSLLPGQGSMDDIIADTEDGILMDMNKSWSIDQMRLNFQFGVEIAWEIKKGKKGKMLKNANYQGTTPEFWSNCDWIAGPEEWVLWGVPNCGKGQPGQRAEMSHGSSPARFRDVMIGVGKDFLLSTTGLV